MSGLNGLLPVVLSQYRTGSGYKDKVGYTYHFPRRYLGPLVQIPVPFVYYEPRTGGGQVYFGAGIVRSIDEDTEEPAHYYADISDYRPFEREVSYYREAGGTWEASTKMRPSVRHITPELYRAILRVGGIIPIDSPPVEMTIGSYHIERLRTALDSLTHRGPVNDGLQLRKIRRVYEAYERPSAVTNAVKRTRGDICQLCGTRGFVKRDGRRYCEIHHLFHLSDDPPIDCLHPEYVVVLCATCHRRMHYGRVGAPVRTADGWTVLVDGEVMSFVTCP
jgi:hypothetical protein